MNFFLLITLMTLAVFKKKKVSYLCEIMCLSCVLTFVREPPIETKQPVNQNAPKWLPFLESQVWVLGRRQQQKQLPWESPLPNTGSVYPKSHLHASQAVDTGGLIRAHDTGPRQTMLWRRVSKGQSYQLYFLLAPVQGQESGRLHSS